MADGHFTYLWFGLFKDLEQLIKTHIPYEGKTKVLKENEKMRPKEKKTKN